MAFCIPILYTDSKHNAVNMTNGTFSWDDDSSDAVLSGYVISRTHTNLKSCSFDSQSESRGEGW